MDGRGARQCVFGTWQFRNGGFRANQKERNRLKRQFKQFRARHQTILADLIGERISWLAGRALKARMCG